MSFMSLSWAGYFITDDGQRGRKWLHAAYLAALPWFIPLCHKPASLKPGDKRVCESCQEGSWARNSEKDNGSVHRRLENQDDYLREVGKQRSSPFLSETMETKIKKKWADTHSGLFPLNLDQNRKELGPTAQNVEKTQIHVRYQWFQRERERDVDNFSQFLLYLLT